MIWAVHRVLIGVVSSSNMRYAGHVCAEGKCIQDQVRKPGAKKTYRPRHRWEYDIKVDLNRLISE